MITTKDYAKVGWTAYSVVADRWDDENGERIWVGSGEYMTPQDAKLAARAWLPKGADVFTIQRGTYIEDRIADDEYGIVRDATWEQDERWQINGWPDGEGGIEWEEEEW